MSNIKKKKRKKCLLKYDKCVFLIFTQAQKEERNIPDDRNEKGPWRFIKFIQALWSGESVFKNLTKTGHLTLFLPGKEKMNLDPCINPWPWKGYLFFKGNKKNSTYWCKKAAMKTVLYLDLSIGERRSYEKSKSPVQTWDQSLPCMIGERFRR